MDAFGNIISEDDVQLVLRKLASLENEPLDKFQKHLKTLSYLTYLFQKQKLMPIIVGGHAVEFYTLGNYTTMDVDLVISGYDKAKELLELVGFKKHPPHSNHWYHDKLNIPIEIPSSVLAGSSEKVIEVQIEEGFFVYIIGIEDLILDRVRAAVHWESSADREWALFLMNAQWNSIDFEYLTNVAKNNKKELQVVQELIQETTEYKSQLAEEE